MKVLLLGLTGFGSDALRATRRAGARVVGVLTRREPGPFPYYDERNLSEEARSLGLPVFEDDNINTLEFFEKMKPLAPDLIVQATYHQKFPHRILKLAPRGGVTIHPSLLPAYRSPTPSTWAIIFGEQETGVTLHELTIRMYEGDLLDQRRTRIDPDDSDGTLRRKLSALGAEMLEAHLRRLAAGEPVTKTPQDEKKITFFPLRLPREGLITFDEPTRNVYNRIRAVTPYPGAHTHLHDRTLKILHAIPTFQQSYEVKAGLVVGSQDGYLLVKTKDGAIRVKVDPPLSADDLRGMPCLSDVKALSAKRVSRDSVVHTREVYGIESGAEEFPLMVVLSVAYPCNARCPHCPYTEGNSEIRLKYADTPYVPPELFKKIADECGPYHSWLRITGGGEPMMHPAGMTDLIEYAKGVGCRVWMNTNGSKITPANADRLLACGIDMIEFSVDAGEPEIYKIVRAGLDWDNLVETMRHMIRRRNETKSPTRITCSMVMQDLIQDKVDGYVKFWKDEIRVDEVIKRKFLTWGSNTTLDAGHAIDPTPYLDKTVGEPCPYPFHRLNIDTRGKIEVCGFDISGRTNFGSVKEKSIKEIWQGPEFSWWRQMHAERRGGEIPLCRECPDWQYRSWNHNYQKVDQAAAKHRQIEIDLVPDGKTA